MPQKNNFSRNILFILGGSVLLLGVIIGIGVYNSQPRTNPVLKLQHFISSQGASHVNPGEPLSYNNYPPTSGNHYATELGWGIFTEPQTEGLWLHSLEHGAIGLLYNCPAGCPDIVKQLENFYKKAPLHGCPEVRAFVMPYSQGMTTPITLVAWQYRLDLEKYDSQIVKAFFEQHEENGPETIPCGSIRMQ